MLTKLACVPIYQHTTSIAIAQLAWETTRHGYQVRDAEHLYTPVNPPRLQRACRQNAKHITVPAMQRFVHVQFPALSARRICSPLLSGSFRWRQSLTSTVPSVPLRLPSGHSRSPPLSLCVYRPDTAAHLQCPAASTVRTQSLTSTVPSAPLRLPSGHTAHLHCPSASTVRRHYQRGWRGGGGGR